MSVDAFQEEFEYIELFNKPALFTNARIDRASVPQGWFCYDLRGGDDDPGQPVTVETHVEVNHAGTVLLPEEIRLDGLPGQCRRIGDGLDFLGESMTLAGFCKEYGLHGARLTISKMSWMLLVYCIRCTRRPALMKTSII